MNGLQGLKRRGNVLTVVFGFRSIKMVVNELIDEKQSDLLIRKFGNPNPPIWYEPPSPIKQGFPNGKITNEEYNEAQEQRTNTILSEESRKKAENHKAVEIQIGNRFELISAWDYFDRAELAKAEVAVLEEAITVRKRRIQIYEVEIAQRCNSPRAKEITTEMKELAKTAITLRPIIVQANSEIKKALEHGEPSVKLSKHFMENLEEYNVAKNEFNSLRHELEFLTDEIASIPEFPPDLTTSEVSSKSNADRVLKRASYGK